MYEDLFLVVFSVNILFMGLLMGYVAHVVGMYFSGWRSTPEGPAKQRYSHVVLLGTSMFYLLLISVVAMLYAVYHDFYNPVIFLIPPGLVMMWLGIRALSRSGRDRIRQER